MIAALFRYAPVQMLSAISVFILIAIHTKFLEPAVYGSLAVALVILELVRAVSTQWLNTAMLRIYPSSSASEKENISQVIFFSAIVGCLFGFLIIAIALYFYKILDVYSFLSLSLLLFLKSIFQYLLEIARLNDKSSLYRRSMLLQTTLSVALSWFLLSKYPTVNVAFLSLSLSFLFSIITFGKPVRPAFNYYTFKNIADYGIPMMFSSFISLLSSSLDKLIIPAALGLSLAGIYAAQINIILGLTSLIFMIVALPMYPELVKLSNDKCLLQRKHATYLSTLLMISLPALLGVIILSEEIVYLFLGEKYYMPQSNVFSFLALAAFLLNIKGHYIDHALQFQLRTKIILYVSIVGFAINSFLIPFSVKYFGLEGAAVTLIITNSFLTIISAWIAIRNGYTYFVEFDVCKVVFSALIMATFLYFLKDSDFLIGSVAFKFVVCVVVAAMFYALCLVALNFMKSRDFLLAKIA
jgi:O-antigen/teichoic acid export membrane protein